MRDRLADFNKKQQDDDERVVLSSVVINVNENLRKVKNENEIIDYLKQAFDCRSKIYQIERLIKRIKELHSMIHGSAARNEDQHQQLNASMDEVRKLFDAVKAVLATMEKTYEAVKAEDLKGQKEAEETKLDEHPLQINSKRPADIRIMSSQFGTLQCCFFETWTEYNECLSKYREKCKQNLTRQIQITGKKVTDEEVNNMIESGNFTIFSYSEHFQQKDLEELENRHKDITNLDESLKQLHGMFKDLALMVEQQGEMLNTIESNVSNALNYVEEAADELEEAEKHAGDLCKRKFICAMVILVIIIIVAAVIGISVYLKAK